jgi:VWFA-related protein
MSRYLSKRGIASVLGALLAVPVAAFGSDRRLPATFGVTASRVAVDVVIRDKDGAILRDLGPADVEVYEDGARQAVESLQFVERESIVPGMPDAREAPAVLAIVLDSLSPGARRAAHAALSAYASRPARGRPVLGVFVIDRGLRPLLAFTDQDDALHGGLRRLLGTGATGFSGLREREDVRHAHAGLGDGSPQTSVVPAELSGEPECRLSGEDLTRRFKVLSSRMKESFDLLERDQQGAASLNGLLALVDALSPLPGRKAVLLFSEGLPLPSGVEAAFRSVVSAANRAGVAVYAADAAGLRARSTADETRRSLEILRTRLELVQGVPPGQRGPGAAEMGDSGLALLERGEDNLRLAPESGLGRLAEQTGGFLLGGTNDLEPALSRIEEDLGSYYLLSYTPTNARFDGGFRRVEVRVKRPHGRLQARQGYLAVAATLPSPLLEAEAAALAQLERGELPAEVPIRLRALQYPEQPPASVVSIVVEVQASRFEAVRGPSGRSFTVVTLVRDRAGQIVAKASDRYPVPPAGSDGGPVLFYREVRLAPGSYTVEALARESRGSRAGAARAALEVVAPVPGQLRASTLMLVGRAEKLDRSASGPRALRFEDVLLYPQLAAAPRPGGQPIVLFVTAWPTAGRPDVEARLELLRDGRVVEVLPAGRHQAGSDGRVQIASSLSIGALPAGDYELRMTLSDGHHAEIRSESLHVAP